MRWPHDKQRLTAGGASTPSREAHVGDPGCATRPKRSRERARALIGRSRAVPTEVLVPKAAYFTPSSGFHIPCPLRTAIISPM